VRLSFFYVNFDKLVCVILIFFIYFEIHLLLFNLFFIYYPLHLFIFILFNLSPVKYWSYLFISPQLRIDSVYLFHLILPPIMY